MLGPDETTTGEFFEGEPDDYFRASQVDFLEWAYSGTIPAWEQPDDIGRMLGEIRRPRWISRHSTSTRKCSKHGIYPIAYVVEDFDMPECPACASIRDTTQDLQGERDRAVQDLQQLKWALSQLMGNYGIEAEDSW